MSTQQLRRHRMICCHMLPASHPNQVQLFFFFSPPPLPVILPQGVQLTRNKRASRCDRRRFIYAAWRELNASKHLLDPIQHALLSALICMLAVTHQQAGYLNCLPVCWGDSFTVGEPDRSSKKIHTRCHSDDDSRNQKHKETNMMRTCCL